MADELYSIRSKALYSVYCGTSLPRGGGPLCKVCKQVLAAMGPVCSMVVAKLIAVI